MILPHPKELSPSARVLVALTALAAVLRFWGLGRQSIWVDESLSIAWAGIFEGMTWQRFLWNLQGPFHSLLLFLWSLVFGTSEAGLRSMEALIGTATVPMLYWAVKPLARPGLGLTASALLALSPFHLWYSQELRGYCLLILFSILSMGVFLRLAEGSRRGWMTYTLSNALGLLSSLCYAFLLSAQACIEAIGGRAGRRLWKGLLLSWTVTLLILSPWLVQFYQRRVQPSRALELRPVARSERIRGETTSPLLGIPYTFEVFSLGFSYGPSLREYHEMPRTGAASLLRAYAVPLAWAGLAFGVGAFLGGVSLLRRGSWSRAWLVLAFIPVLLTYGTATRNLKVMNPRYAAAAFPAYLVVLAAGILAPKRSWQRLALAGAILLPTGVSLAQYEADPRYYKEDARAAAAYLRQEGRPGDAVFLVGTDLPFRTYYWRRGSDTSAELTIEDAWHWVDLTREEQVRRFRELRQAHRRVFALFLRSKDVDQDGFWLQYLRDHDPPAETKSFPGVRILTLGAS